MKTAYVTTDNKCHVTDAKTFADWSNIAVAFDLTHGTLIAGENSPQLWSGDSYIISDKYVPDATSSRSQDDCIAAILADAKK